MPKPLRIFLGSSHETKPTAKKLAHLLKAYGGDDVEVVPWWGTNVFEPPRYFMDSLKLVMERTDAALLLAAEEDRTFFRGKTFREPRDNVILEYGMSVAAHTLEGTVLAVIGEPRLPSDLDGVTHLCLDKESGNFTTSDREEIEALLNRWMSMPSRIEIQKILPNVYRSILRLVTACPNRSKAKALDALAAAVFDSITDHFDDDASAIPEWVCRDLNDYLKKAKAIQAIDVSGPATWLTPNAFRYLAMQIRRYFRANIKPNETFKFSPAIARAIRRCSDNMKKMSGGGQSVTKFDDQLSPPGSAPTSDFYWAEGEVDLEFCRVLLWTKEELENPITETISNIHEAVNVPLFALLVRPGAMARKFDFIAFTQSDGSVKGFYSCRKDKNGQRFVTERLEGARIPRCEDHWQRIFSHPQLMFAADIHHLLQDTKNIGGKLVEVKL